MSETQKLHTADELIRTFVAASLKDDIAGAKNAVSAMVGYTFETKPPQEAEKPAQPAGTDERERSEDEMIAVSFYKDNPSAALFDFNRRLSPKQKREYAAALSTKAEPAAQQEAPPHFVELLTLVLANGDFSPQTQTRLRDAISFFRGKAAQPPKEAALPAQSPVAYYRDVRAYLEYENSAKEDHAGYMRREWWHMAAPYATPKNCRPPENEGWIPVYATPPAAPLSDEEQRAIMEGERNAACDDYIKARPQLDTIHNRRIFEKGFEAGYRRSLLSRSIAAPVPEGWISVNERLPEVGVLVMVYAPPSQHDWPDTINISFDCIDPDADDPTYWLNHGEHYEHFCCVGKPEGSVGPSEKAPYTHWMPLPAAPSQEGKTDADL